MARGPTPSYPPSLTPEQLAQAQRVAACHHAPYLKVQRARIALALQTNPHLSQADLCALSGLNRRTVQRLRKRWHTDGFTLDDAPRSGRPPAFSPSPTRADQSRRL